jgi:hypothetical protein
MSNKPQQPIKEALGLGESFKFSDGTQLPCVPACLEDFEEAIQHWSVSLGKNLSVLGCYHPQNNTEGNKTKEAFEELLFIACGRGVPKERLRKEIRVGDGAEEVIAFINRFLGLNQRQTGAETQTE